MTVITFSIKCCYFNSRLFAQIAKGSNGFNQLNYLEVIEELIIQLVPMVSEVKLPLVEWLRMNFSVLSADMYIYHLFSQEGNEKLLQNLLWSGSLFNNGQAGNLVYSYLGTNQSLG